MGRKKKIMNENVKKETVAPESFDEAVKDVAADLEIPQSFEEGLKDLEAGRVIDMEVAHNEIPLSEVKVNELGETPEEEILRKIFGPMDEVSDPKVSNESAPDPEIKNESAPIECTPIVPDEEMTKMIYNPLKINVAEFYCNGDYDFPKGFQVTLGVAYVDEYRGVELVQIVQHVKTKRAKGFTTERDVESPWIQIYSK